MFPSPVTDLKTFVPAKDPELSKEFYVDLGFTVNWSNEQIAELQIGSFRFLLQTFYVAEHAGNFMMSLQVEDADAWWEHIQRKEFATKYPGIICRAPEMQPWGIRVLYLSDPTVYCGTSWTTASRNGLIPRQTTSEEKTRASTSAYGFQCRCSRIALRPLIG